MPEAEDGGMRFVTVNDDFKLGFEEAVDRRDDDVEGEDDKVIFLASPLEVMLRANLNRSGVSEGGGNNGFVVRNME